MSNTFSNETTQDIVISGKLLGFSQMSFNINLNTVSAHDMKHGAKHIICHFLYTMFLHAAIFLIIPISIFMCSIKRTTKGLKLKEKEQRA
jgi:hypothetical protein